MKKWDALRTIWKVLKSDAGQHDKLQSCMNIADVYCAMTGDDSLVLPQVREIRARLASQVAGVMARADVQRKNAELGIMELL